MVQESGWQGSAKSSWVSLGPTSKVTAGCMVRAKQIEEVVGWGALGCSRLVGPRFCALL